MERRAPAWPGVPQGERAVNSPEERFLALAAGRCDDRLAAWGHFRATG